MFETTLQTKTEERGQVGIGTLIVFIALVLVAAIAAGVLINTAGFLQSQAEQTGQDSTDQVSNNINIVGTSAEISSSSDIQNVQITVGLAPGANPINIGDSTIQLIGNGGTTTSSTAGFSGVGDVSGSTLEESGDQVQISIDLSSESVDNLEAGDELEVRIITSDGSRTTTILSAPDPLVGDEGTGVNL